MMRIHQREPLPFEDMVLQAEYFASLCGFQYPDTQVDRRCAEGRLPLRAPIQPSSDDSAVHGMMVWQNKNYIPSILFVNHDTSVDITIENNRQLPYPAILRTEAWLTALHYYLSAKTSAPQFSSDIESKAKRKFIERILTQ